MIVFVTKKDNLHTLEWFLDSYGKTLADSVYVLSYERLLRRRRVPIAT